MQCLNGERFAISDFSGHVPQVAIGKQLKQVLDLSEVSCSVPSHAVWLDLPLKWEVLTRTGFLNPFLLAENRLHPPRKHAFFLIALLPHAYIEC